MSRDVLAFLNSFLVAPPPLPLATIDFVVAATSVAPLLLIQRGAGGKCSLHRRPADRSKPANKSERAREAPESLGRKTMDGAANWRPTQGADPAAVAASGGVDPNAAAPAGSDWRTQLQPEARHRIVNKMYVLSIFLPSLLPLMGIVKQLQSFPSAVADPCRFFYDSIDSIRVHLLPSLLYLD